MPYLVRIHNKFTKILQHVFKDSDFDNLCPLHYGGFQETWIIQGRGHVDVGINVGHGRNEQLNVGRSALGKVVQEAQDKFCPLVVAP